MAIKATGKLFVNGVPAQQATTAELSAPVGVDNERGVFKYELGSDTTELIEFIEDFLDIPRPEDKPKPDLSTITKRLLR